MKWKEKFEEEFPALFEHQMSYEVAELLMHFISTEIIEKLIEDIPDNANVRDPYEGDIDLSGKELKQQLRNKWL